MDRICGFGTGNNFWRRRSIRAQLLVAVICQKSQWLDRYACEFNAFNRFNLTLTMILSIVTAGKGDLWNHESMKTSRGHIGALENAVGERRKSRLPRTNRNQLLAPIFSHLEAADEAEALKHFQSHYRQVSLGCINALYLFAECISHLPRLTFAG